MTEAVRAEVPPEDWGVSYRMLRTKCHDRRILAMRYGGAGNASLNANSRLIYIDSKANNLPQLKELLSLVG